jgi:hypothetical protein
MNEALNPFESFTTDDWIVWLDAVLAGNQASPSPPNSRRELDQDLLALFKNLPISSASGFSSAVGELVRTTTLTSRSSSRLFTLLQIAATAKPRGLDTYLDRLLRDEVCQHLKLEYGNSDIHSDVLSTLSRYGVDERLVDYIEDSVSRTTDFGYALNGFRIAALLNAQSAARVAPLVADLATVDDQEARLRQFAVQLLEVALRHQFRSLLEFFLDLSERETIARMGTIALAVLASGCADEALRSPTMKGFQSVINTCARATVMTIPLAEVLAAGENHRTIGLGFARRALDHIWRVASLHSKGPVPWEFVSHDEEFAPTRLLKKLDCLFSVDGDNVEFDGRLDPLLVQLLSQVSTAQRPRVAELAGANA